LGLHGLPGRRLRPRLHLPRHLVQRPDLGLPRGRLRAAAARAAARPPGLPPAAGRRAAETPAARGRDRARLKVRQDLVRVEAQELVLVLPIWWTKTCVKQACSYS